MTYRAEFEDGEMEVFEAENRDKAMEEAFGMAKDHGDVFNVTALDESYNEIETIF
jgi:hypothetical protein